ncbi:MAG: ABC transporter ATP-binding protein [Blastochloris sp.]|nr:ABC transporter ATP-binding protein [Blastochloris sp.]
MAWLTKRLIDILTNHMHTNDPSAVFPELLLILVGIIGASLIGQLVLLTSAHISAEMNRALTLHVKMIVYRKINHLAGIAHFERPHFYNVVSMATQGAEQGPSRMLTIIATTIQNISMLIGFMSILISYNILLTIIVGVSIIPSLFVELDIGKRHVKLAYEATNLERKAFYYNTLLSREQYAKEVRLFNLSDYFLQAFHTISQSIHTLHRTHERHELRWKLTTSTLANIVANGALVVVIMQAFYGSLSVGDVLLFMSAVGNTQSALSGLLFALADINETMLFFAYFQKLLAMPQSIMITAASQPIPSLKQGIELQNVSFRYEDTSPWILNKVNLTIPAGHSVALVGLNGAGKTTLTKLLLRLYDPTEGTILWDGIDIRLFDPLDLRQCISAVFQDFVCYDLTAYENIGLGNVDQIHDDTRVHLSAKQAGAHEVIEQLKNRYQTVLSRWLADDHNGVDLSGGQWQKIAIARMLMRNANLLVLDEPTAALDVQIENDLYHRFSTLVDGRTCLLISHRFSTVRMANLIAVMEDGRIVEYGSHEELLQHGGQYAAWYLTQAGFYR